MRPRAQVRGGPTESQNLPARRTPRSSARSPERRAPRERRRQRRRRKRIAEPRRAEHSPGLWPPAGSAGFLPEPRSFLPFPLPLPSLRSDISPEKRTLCADRSQRRRRATSLVRGLGSGLGKVCPSRERARGRAAALARRGGVSCRLRGAARTRRAVRATWGWRSLLQPVALALGAAPVARGSPRFPPRWGPALSAPAVASVRRARSPRRERRSPSCPRSHRPGSRRRSAPALRASPEFRQVLGNSSPALFQLPHSHPPPARRLQTGASFSPSPCLAPSLFPTTPPPRGADTPPGGAWARRSRAQPLSLPEPGGAGGGGARRGCREAPTGVAGSCAETPQPPSREANWAAPGDSKTEEGTQGAPRSPPLPGSPRGLLGSQQCGETLERKSGTLDTCPPAPVQALEPSGRRTYAFFPGEFGVRSFPTLVRVPHTRRAKTNQVQGNTGVRLFQVHRKGAGNPNDGQIAPSSQICSVKCVCILRSCVSQRACHNSHR